MAGTRLSRQASFIGLAVLVLVLVMVQLARVDRGGDVAIQASAGGSGPVLPEPVLEPAGDVQPATTTTAAPVTTITRRAPVTIPPPAVRPGMTTTTSTITAPAAVSAVAPVTSTKGAVVTSSSTTSTVSPTTTTTVVPCRNSTDPACGPFRFHTEPAADRPMTVAVVTEPAIPVAGQEMVFRITLTDPDGASYGSSLDFLGDSGLGETTREECGKFGAWDPPAPDPAGAEVVLTVRHTYAQAGTYPTSFAFEAGPFDCTDSVTGRGDRPYASSATATHTVVVAP